MQLLLRPRQPHSCLALSRSCITLLLLLLPPLLLLLWITEMSYAFSGVIAVAVYGLYGAATNKWDISLKIEAHGAFDAFWETMAFIVNGIIFFYSGVACINFIVR